MNPPPHHDSPALDSMAIHGLQPYPAYKDSGVPWLGDVPAGWDIRRNGRLWAERKDTGFPDLPILEVSLRTGVRVRAFGSSQRKQVMKNRDTYKRAAKGDLAYNMMRMWQGAVGIAPVDGLVSPAYVVARPFPGTTPEYFPYLYRTATYMGEVEDYSHGIVADRNRLYWDEFKQIPTPFPPPLEQAAIVRFLGHADRRIRRYIAAKQKLIQLLEEEKEGVIHKAVTQGLDSSIRLKPSGVAWLGEVPVQWDVMALRLRYAQCLGKMLDAKRFSGEHAIPYLRNIDVQWDHVNVSGLPVIDVPPDEYDRYTVRRGDLLVCEGGEVGRSAIWSGDLEVCAFQKALHRLRPHSSSADEPRFLLFVLRAASRRGAFADGHESTIAHLTGDKLRAHRFAFPPKLEQMVIVRSVDDMTSRANAAIQSADREISLLREYRNRLIVDVVTGKLDVRAAAAGLPDEGPEAQAAPDSDEDATADDPENDVGADRTGDP